MVPLQRQTISQYFRFRFWTRKISVPQAYASHPGQTGPREVWNLRGDGIFAAAVRVGQGRELF